MYFYVNAWIHVFVNVCYRSCWSGTRQKAELVTLCHWWSFLSPGLQILYLPCSSFFELWHVVAGYNLEVRHIQYVGLWDVHSTVKQSLFCLVANFITAEKCKLPELLALVSPKSRPILSQIWNSKNPRGCKVKWMCQNLPCLALPCHLLHEVFRPAKVRFSAATQS